MKLPSFLLLLFVSIGVKAATDYQLWYNSPGVGASQGALPIGNGHIGMMLQCKPINDTSYLSDCNLYSDDGGTEMHFGYLNRVHINYPNNAVYSNYKRVLDVGEATLGISYTSNAKQYYSEYIASFPDSCIINHVTCNVPASITAVIGISDGFAFRTMSVSASGALLRFFGTQNHTKFPATPVELQIYVKKLGANGSVAPNGNTIVATNCDSLDIFIAVDDQFKHDASSNYLRSFPTAHAACSTIVARASAQTYDQLRARHIADYQSLFNRFILDLNAPVNSAVATDQRLAKYKTFSGNDLGFQVLMGAYGRYLMIGSSRNKLPPGLVGIYEPKYYSDWTGGFYNNINAQMMWGSLETNNLAECAVPFINFVNNIRPALRAASQIADPGERGYACWHRSNPYGGTTEWKYEGGTPWNLDYAYDHFRFDQDTQYLQENIYPNMKEVSQHLIDHQKLINGKYVTCDGWSPEAGTCGKDTNTAHDGQTTWDLLSNTLEAATILGIDSLFRDTLKMRLSQIDNGINHIGPKGDLLEFANSTVSLPAMRHASHLFCMSPGHQVSPLLDTKTFVAAQKALNLKQIGSTGWSFMYLAGIDARCCQGDSAFRRLDSALTHNYSGQNMLNHDTDPASAWQMDGNIGFCAVLPELLAQSHIGYIIQLLPALPSKWPRGTVQGLRLRNGFVIDKMTWENGKLSEAYIKSILGKQCKIYGSQYAVFENSSNTRIPQVISDGCQVFPTIANKVYKVMLASNVGTAPNSMRSNDNNFRVTIGQHDAGRRLVIALNENPWAHLSVRLFDSKGQQVAKANVRKNQTAIQMEMSHCVQGTYFVSLADGQQNIYCKKILVVR